MLLRFGFKSKVNCPESNLPPPLPVYLMTWLMTMGSGCCSNPASFMGISEKRSRPQLKIWGGCQRVGDALAGTRGNEPSQGSVENMAED